MRNVNKFAIFVAKNSNMPFSLKMKVFEAALTSAMIYSSESWLSNDLRIISKHYISAVKILLGVRNATSYMLCLLEVGYPDLDKYVLKRRIEFLTKFMNSATEGTPLAQVMKLCRDNRTPGYRMMEYALNYYGDPVAQNMTHMKERRNNSQQLDKFNTITNIFNNKPTVKFSSDVWQQTLCARLFKMTSHSIPLVLT